MKALATRSTEDKEFPLSLADFRYLSSVVYDQTGIVLKDHKINMVYSRLARRLRELGLTSFNDYCRLLESERGTEETGFLINAITTNLTKFFRENHHFEHLADVALKEAAAAASRTGLRRLRIWSAGCSSGEEPYSIAMTLLSRFPRLREWNAKILATDLDTAMVARGRAGRYADRDLENVPASLRKRYFSGSTSAGETAASDDLRALITFKQLNLLSSWPMTGPFDAIFCRNVMIYFDEATKTGLIDRFATMLKPGGWLYIGHSETLLDTGGKFQLMGRTIYRRRDA
ncbi:CheR family methyltransferase [Roseibium sp.]|uniref:CheR family methyltransferase n=3 Tax=Roseibium sp. TaxID=1936156 RepID=UPI003D0C7A7E